MSNSLQIFFLLSCLHGVFSQLHAGGIEGADSVHAWIEGVEESGWLQGPMCHMQLGNWGRSNATVPLRMIPGGFRGGK